MTVWILLLAGLTALLTGLLLTPLRLEIDSIRGIYQFRWYGLLTLNWLPEEALDMLEIRTFFFKKKIRLSAQTALRQRRTAVKPAAKIKSRAALSPGRILQLVLNLLKTFRVRHCRIYWDTDDFMLNAWLFPLVWMLGKQESVLINFRGQRDCVMVVENRAGRLLWAFAKSFMFT